MNRIERGLFLGSLEAATDVILLESNAITHIVTVDSVPLPRKITSMMPRIAILHLQVCKKKKEILEGPFAHIFYCLLIFCQKLALGLFFKKNLIRNR